MEGNNRYLSNTNQFWGGHQSTALLKKARDAAMHTRIKRIYCIIVVLNAEDAPALVPCPRQHGRQLASMTTTDGSVAWEYTYNADGLRTKRTNGTTTYEYIYNGSSLSQI